MANDKNKIKELVSDEDPTAELEVISFRDHQDISHDQERESDAHTFGLADFDESAPAHNQSVAELRSDLQSRTKTIGRLQYDIEQLRSKWMGLETEIAARQEIADGLKLDIVDLQDTVARKEKLLKKRDVTIRSLKVEIRQRDEDHRSLELQHSDLEQQLNDQFSATSENDTALQAARSATEELRDQLTRERERSSAAGEQGNVQALDNVQAQLSRTEQYADDLRIKLKDLTDIHDGVSRDRDRLAQSLAQKMQSNHELTHELAATKEGLVEMQQEIEKLEQSHAEDIRIIRFELGEAQNTIAETNDLNSQLTSDLVDTRSYKEELERMMSNSEEQSQQRIEDLEKDLGKLARTAEDYEQKLESKSAAINVLLSELAKKSEQIEAIGEIEDVIQDIDDRMSERFDDVTDSVSDDVSDSQLSETSSSRTSKDRDKITRVLIGRIGEQVLRFPLFKDRLTIGRTEDNDIQLKLSYISRRHAVVMTEGDATRVIDWGSKNGVYVNSKRVKEHFLSNGDVVAVGNAKFRYEERRKRDC